MTEEQKIKFQYYDLISRNLIDEETAEKELEKELKKLREKENKKDTQKEVVA
jgi:hypothetical protein